VASAINLGVIAFLDVVAIWLFWRNGEVRDRAFLAVASLLYIAAMAATAWIFSAKKEIELISWLLLVTVGLLLVKLSKRMKESSK
jgi:uncharacterized membrane protein YfcA